MNSKARGMNDHYTSTNTKVMEDIARNLPLSKEHRPEWDTKELLKIGYKKIMLEMEIGNRVWNEEETLNYGSTPMFMIGAEK